MQDLNIFYNSYAVADGSGPDVQQLTLTVTDRAADVIMRAAVLSPDDYSKLAPIDMDDLRMLHTLQKVCEGLEQLSGRSIYRRGESRPWKYCGLELEFDVECAEGGTDEEG